MWIGLFGFCNSSSRDFGDDIKVYDGASEDTCEAWWVDSWSMFFSSASVCLLIFNVTLGSHS